MPLMTVEAAKALTAMLYGAPVGTRDAKALIAAIALNDHLRSTGESPVDPTSFKAQKRITLPAHIQALVDAI